MLVRLLGGAVLAVLVSTCAPGDHVSAGAQFLPVPLPDPGIPGFTYPEDSGTVASWVEEGDSASIDLHAWGLWAAVTAETSEVWDGQPLRVFETWLTPTDILRGRGAIGSGQVDDQAPTQDFSRSLGALSQLSDSSADSTVLGSVKYDPTAAGFVGRDNLLRGRTLDSLVAAGVTDVPGFPSTAMTLKPVFRAARVPDGGRYYALPVWPGPTQPVKQQPPSEWTGCIWIDTQDPSAGPGNGEVDEDCDSSGSSRAGGTTYGLGRFIHFTESETPFVLVAMHVTTREMPSWTWQTFWWSPTPDTPESPSSSATADARPEELQGAVRSYAACSAYAMLSSSGAGPDEGNSIYCYNPWLEAGFGPADLPASQPGIYNGRPASNDFGVQTNCMSCHAQARWPANLDGETNCDYTGDQAIDFEGVAFHSIKLDYAWSLQVASAAGAPTGTVKCGP